MSGPCHCNLERHGMYVRGAGQDLTAKRGTNDNGRKNLLFPLSGDCKDIFENLA